MRNSKVSISLLRSHDQTQAISGCAVQSLMYSAVRIPGLALRLSLSTRRFSSPR